jgi:hypothetical protein
MRGVNWRRDFDAVKRAAGWGSEKKKLTPWTQDIMRHTAISNHLAYFQHEGKTAAWAGNSPDIIQRHYKGLVKQADAVAFWGIAPVKRKVVRLKTKRAKAAVTPTVAPEVAPEVVAVATAA